MEKEAIGGRSVSDWKGLVLFMNRSFLVLLKVIVSLGPFLGAFWGGFCIFSRVLEGKYFW